jgi:formate C-acetyltransferase
MTPRIAWLRDYYFKGADREWNNEYASFGTGTDWDVITDETFIYTMYNLMPSLDTTDISTKLTARVIPIPDNFFTRSLTERRAWFIKEVMVNYLPKEILPGDLLAGARFQLRVSKCLSKEEHEEREAFLKGDAGLRKKILVFNEHGFGSCGPTPGHLIPGFEKIVKHGFKHQYEYIKGLYKVLSEDEKHGEKGAQLRAMMTACTLPRDLAAAYSKLCADLATQAKTQERRKELEQMADNLTRVPWEGARDFWEAVMSLWMTHMLVMSDENYPGAGDSFGRLDQYLYPYWKKSVEEGMDPDFGKEILKCMWIHCNTVYDAQIRIGNQGITAGYGQLFTFSGMGKDGKDVSNDLTYVLMDVVQDMYPMLEPKPNVRLHRGTPDKLLDRVIELIAESQGAPFLINFDERSMAGLLREAKMSNAEHLINKDNVYDYASVGCLENTMVGNDRSETVNLNLNLVKSVEFVLGNGREIVDYTDMRGNVYPKDSLGIETGDPRKFKDFEEFFEAFELQLRNDVRRIIDIYNQCDIHRMRYVRAPYLSVLVKGCAESGTDVNCGGAELKYATVEGVTFATTVDSLLAVKYLVYDEKLCSMDELIQALKDNWEGHELLQARAKNRAPKYGRDDNIADETARRVMEIWSDECWKHKSVASGEQFRGGMLSWNYWITYAPILFATPDGRKRGQFLSNAICPSNGADLNGPTANVNSVGKALGGKDPNGGDFANYVNYLPNGASHTITFSPALLRDAAHTAKFKAFLRGYIENGGTALQINVLDPHMLLEAQEKPEDFRHLLVRVTGYNAYFVTVGKELQNEIIAREMQNKY